MGKISLNNEELEYHCCNNSILRLPNVFHTRNFQFEILRCRPRISSKKDSASIILETNFKAIHNMHEVKQFTSNIRTKVMKCENQFTQIVHEH